MIALEKDQKLINLLSQDSSLVDQSSHDQTIMNKLAFWLNHDKDKMCQVFMESKYFKSKDDYHVRKWQRDDYRERTIQNAIDFTPTTAQEKDKKFQSKKEKNQVTNKIYSTVNVTELNDIEDDAFDDNGSLNLSNAAEGINRLKELRSKRLAIEPILTGFEMFDASLGGSVYNGLYIIGGSPSIGKTSFLGQIVDNFAMYRKKVLFLSLEMSESEMISKSLSRITYQNAAPVSKDSYQYLASTSLEILNPHVCYGNPDDKEKYLNEAYNNYKQFSNNIYYLEGDTRYHLDTIDNELTKFVNEFGEAPILIIDYLQIFVPYADSKYQNDKQRIDDAVVGLKRLVRKYNIPVIAISSLNRDAYKPGGGSISTVAFKESGSIEYAADVLIQLSYEMAGFSGYDELKEKQRIIRRIKCTFLKNRYHSVGSEIIFNYVPAYNYFEEDKSNACGGGGWSKFK